jgi:ABC-type bacteriocin/lantibiotic exporter with double-glycine peptidase domain
MLILIELGLKPEVWQRRNTCGPNCLYVLLKCKERNVRIDQLIAEFRIKENGVSIESMRQVACSMGLGAIVVQTTPQEVLSIVVDEDFIRRRPLA